MNIMYQINIEVKFVSIILGFNEKKLKSPEKQRPELFLIDIKRVILRG